VSGGEEGRGLIALRLSASAQEAPKFFRLDFVVKEFDDNKLLSAKTYSTFMSTDERQKGALIRTGNKAGYSPNPGTTNFVDVGVNIDCSRLQEVNGQLIVQVQAELSSIPGGEILANTPALVRINRWNASRPDRDTRQVKTAYWEVCEFSSPAFG